MIVLFQYLYKKYGSYNSVYIFKYTYADMAEFIVLERQFKIRQTPGDILSAVLSDNSVYIFKYT